MFILTCWCEHMTSHPVLCPAGQTGHTEVVRVVFHPDQLSFSELLKVFWESHNPTQGAAIIKQFCVLADKHMKWRWNCRCAVFICFSSSTSNSNASYGNPHFIKLSRSSRVSLTASPIFIFFCRTINHRHFSSSRTFATTPLREVFRRAR